MPEKTKGLFVKNRLKERMGVSILSPFLLLFMLLLFGPAEVFFANVSEFQFVFGEFFFPMLYITIGVTIGIALLLLLLPKIVYKVALSLLSGITFAGYIQVMFLNKKLDLLGQNPDGYHVETSQIVINCLIWVFIIAAILFVCFFKEKIWKAIVMYGSAFLLCIQMVAIISLFLTAKDEAYTRSTEADWHLSGDDQITVSANKNIIVFVLDYFSNQYIKPMQEKYPDALQCLHDFTYYNNADCTYFGTFPSLPHMLTGCDEDPTVKINEWCANIWSNEKTNSFYDSLKQKNYKVNLYTPDLNILCGQNDVSMLADKFSNMINQYDEVIVNTNLLVKTLFKMSAYRMFPEAVKPVFYANMNEYIDIVSFTNTRPYHYNSMMYQMLMQDGVSTDADSNYFIIQHLMGLHQYINDEKCSYVEESTLEDTGMGIMVMLDEYMKQLKDLDVYDNATIIITSDHGGPEDPQVIFFMKQPQEKHDSMIVTNAPISHCELLPTIAEAAGLNSNIYGQTVTQFTKDEQRERTYWLRIFDDQYPYIQNYSNEKEGASNVIYGYTYTGEFKNLEKIIKEGPTVVIPALDSFF